MNLMNMKKFVLTLASLMVLIPMASFAHEGHGVHGPAHYVTSPEHAMPVVLILAIAAYFVRKRFFKKA